MRSIFNGNRTLAVSALFGFLLMCPYIACAQETSRAAAAEASQAAQKVDLATVESLLHQLQAEVRDLRGQVKDLKVRQESAQAESAELQKELVQTRSQLLTRSGSANSACADTCRTFRS